MLVPFHRVVTTPHMTKRSLRGLILAERQRGETRQDQAERLGIPYMSLSNYEQRGLPKRPQASTAVHLAKLGVILGPNSTTKAGGEK